METLPERTGLIGFSMGGSGALTLGLRHPAKFGIIVALEPGIMPALNWSDVPKRNRYAYADVHFETLHGKPVDGKHRFSEISID